MTLPTGKLGGALGQSKPSQAPQQQPMPQQPMPQQMGMQPQPQQKPVTQPLPPGALSSSDVIQMVMQMLEQKYRDPSFAVPVSISEPPVRMQMPGLVEPKPQTANPFPFMGGAGSPQGLMPPPSMQALPGLHQGSPGALPAPTPGGIEPSQPQAQQQGQGLPPGFNPADTLLM